jgi:general secretion pathway protein H
MPRPAEPARQAGYARVLAGARASIDRRGFTFIELVVVLAIIGLAAAVAVPAIEGGLDTREVNRAARQLRAMMHYLSTEAVATGKDRRLHIKPSENRIELDDGSRWAVLTERAQFERVLGGAVLGDGSVDILFYPNGSSSGADVTIASRRDRFGNRRRLVLDPLTCGVRVEDEG